MNRRRQSPARQPGKLPVLECLSQEHRHIAALLGLLDQRARSRSDLAAGDLYLLADVIGYLHDFPDHVHHPTENLLFDRLLKRRPDLAPELAGLRDEHEQLAAETKDLLDTLDGLIAAGGATAPAQIRAHARSRNLSGLRPRIRQFVHNQRAHMEREGRNVFAVARTELLASDWRALEQRTRLHDDPLFGASVHPRQRLLFEYLAHPQRSTSTVLLAEGLEVQERLVGMAEALETGASEAAGIFETAARTLFGEARDLVLGERHYADPWQRLAWPWHCGRLLGQTAWNSSNALLRTSGKTARDVLLAALRKAQPGSPP